jgi:predicted methyltransferase
MVKSAFLIAVLAAAMCSAQVAREANQRYQTVEGRSAIGAGLGQSQRDAQQRPKELVAAMKLQPGMTVADLGTGVGYMLPYLSAAVGPGGKVIAEDIFPDFLEKARAKAAAEKLGNVTFVLGTDRDPKLPASALDAVLVLDVYHHFDYPAQMLAAISKSLKQDGRLFVVEYHRNEESMAGGYAMKHIRLGRDEAIKEIEANGFGAEEVHDHVPRVQWMATFRKR